MTEAELTAIEERCAKATPELREWRPFVSAPTNRAEILVYREDAGVFTALYTPALADDGEEDEDNYCWFTTAGDDLTSDLPTHWMPFPHEPEYFSVADIPALVAEVRRLREALHEVDRTLADNIGTDDLKRRAASESTLVSTLATIALKARAALQEEAPRGG